MNSLPEWNVTMTPNRDAHGWQLTFFFSDAVAPFMVYCLDPSMNDDCWALCPNPDIAGFLVRVAHYTTGCCLTILILYSPERVKDAFYYQMSTVYTLLITCIASLSQKNITQYHAVIAVLIASSPVSICFLAYSIRAFWGKHRLEGVLGKREYLNRGLVFIAAGMWIAVFVYTQNAMAKRFSQGSCGAITIHDIFHWWATFTPQEFFTWNPWIIIPIVAVLSWIVSIFLARKEIWLPGERYQPKFTTVWKTISCRYPLVFFVSVGLTPLTFWISMVESIVPFPDWFYFLASSSFSFGQVLALFIAAPPLLQVCQLLPQLGSWIINFSWIAWCRRRLRRTEGSTEQIDLSLEAVYYTHPENRASSEEQIMEASGGQRHPGQRRGGVVGLGGEASG